MRKIVWLLPLLIGIFLGFVAPAESSHLRTYYAHILPASGSGGQSPTLTCGWHGGSCGSGGGDYLDWDNTNTNAVYFRGIFRRSGASYETDRLKGYRQRINGGATGCDVQEVSIIHDSSSTRLGKMRYLHVSTSSNGYFPIATSSGGIYNSKYIGEMAYDADCGSWSGTHVHAGYVTIGAASRTKNSGYPSGDYCPSGTCYRTYRNDSPTNWTHQLMWSGP